MTDIETNKTEEAVAADSGEVEDQISISEFLESIPPNQEMKISDITIYRQIEPSNKSYVINTPEIQLHCSHESCNGTRFFRCLTKPIPIRVDDWGFVYLTYRCSNCQKITKVFAIAAVRNEEDYDGKCFKFGEYPPFGPPTPSRLIKLIGPDRDMFLKGRRCENQGLGVAAFTYYRRVVENQKNRIFDEIIKVANKLDASKEDIEELEDAKRETQFSKSLSMVKKGLPQTLLINGHNPISLLHKALSEGVHDRTDEDCLELASSVRVVLGELSERLAQALKNEAELNHALSNLLSGKEKKTK